MYVVPKSLLHVCRLPPRRTASVGQVARASARKANRQSDPVKGDSKSASLASSSSKRYESCTTSGSGAAGENGDVDTWQHAERDAHTTAFFVISDNTRVACLVEAEEAHPIARRSKDWLGVFTFSLVSCLTLFLLGNVDGGHEVRMLPAGALLLVWAILDKRPRPQGVTAWIWILLFGLTDATCFQAFLAEGLQRTSAGLGSIIIDSQPLTVALLASLLFGERLTAVGYAGLGVGVLGLCLLELPLENMIEFLDGTNHVQQTLDSTGNLWESGEWWMLLAAQSMAVGTVLVRYVSKYADPVMATGYHMLLGGVPLAILSAQQEGQLLAERLPLLTGLDYLLLAFISLLGSAASYGVFFLNASRGNLTALSSLTFLTPCFAAATGYLALGETLTLQQLIGAGITLVGVYFISGTSELRNE